ncbi:MAG: hypothetical protein MUE72_09735 [Chitinophagaceae bacterium]|jgi:hypothetical protein|nr:hypothetical protein [Chitinophagaceae bacterium]
MRTRGKRNRSAGSNWERELAKLFRDIGYLHVVTTRSESRSRDAQKIDLINKDEGVNGRLPFNIQAKNVVGHLKYGKVLAEMPKDDNMNVVLHKQTYKKGDRFIESDRFAIMYMEDFIKLIVKLLKNEHRNNND